MKQEILHNFPHIQLTCIALLLFFSSFLSIIIYSFHSQNKAFFSKVALIPFEEE